MIYLVTKTTSFYDNDPWRDNVDVFDEVTFVAEKINLLRKLGIRRYADLLAGVLLGLKLLAMSEKYSGFAIGRYSIWFPVFMKCLRNKKPIVMMDTEWKNISDSGRINRWASSASVAVQANTVIEIKRYAQAFGIPEEKFNFIRLAYQSRDIFPVGDQGYVLAGGRQGRDWETVRKVAESLPNVAFMILTDNPLPPMPANVTTEYVARHEFYRRMANASCVLVPVLPEPLRITGTTTWTNAMAMGKVVVATDPFGAPDYINNKINGFYADYGDWKSVSDAVEQVMTDKSLRIRMGEQARLFAMEHLSPVVYKQKILSILDDCVA